MFDIGNIGDGSDRSTFLFDDVEQIFNGTQIDYPVDFEGTGINYTTLEFGGNVSRLAADPVAGRLVESMAPENNMVRLHNDEMQAGVYLCRILTESGEGAVRLVKD